MTRTAIALAAYTTLANLPAQAQSAGYLERYVDPSLYTCAQLYKARNDFYNRRGLCFTRPGALELYPNNPFTCRYESSADMPMTARETKLMRAIVAYEQHLGCPRP